MGWVRVLTLRSPLHSFRDVMMFRACKINYAGLIRKHNWLEKGASPGKPTRSPDRTPHGKTEPRRRLSKMGDVPSVSLRGQNKGCASRRRRRRRRTSGGGSGHAPLEIALTFPIRLSLPRSEFVQVEKQSQIQYWNNTNEWTRPDLRKRGGLSWSGGCGAWASL